jgi:hypothetical protein
MCSNWLKLWRSFCQKLLSPWNCNIIEMMTGLSSAKFVIFLPIAYPRWPPQGNLVYHWTLWEFHWKTFLWETTQQIEYFALYECSLDGYTWSIILVQIGNPTWLPGPIMCSDWLKLWRSSCQKLLSWWNCNIIEMMTGWSSTKFVIFVPIGNPRWQPQGDLV